MKTRLLAVWAACCALAYRVAELLRDPPAPGLVTVADAAQFTRDLRAAHPDDALPRRDPGATLDYQAPEAYDTEAPTELVERIAAVLPGWAVVHQQVAGWAGPAGGCGVECGCGVAFDGFDTIAEALDLLAVHIGHNSEVLDGTPVFDVLTAEWPALYAGRLRALRRPTTEVRAAFDAMVGPLAVDWLCSHCEVDDHADCPGCSCACSLVGAS